MKTKTGRKITLTLLTAVLLIFISAASVFAEGEILPEETPTAEETQTEETVPIEEMASVEGSPIEEDPPAEAPITASETASESSMEPDPEITAADWSAEALPLEEAPPVEEVVAEMDTLLEPAAEADLMPAAEPCASSSSDDDDYLGSDPYFTVGTQVYRWLPFGGDCTPYLAAGDICTASPGDTPIQDAIDYIEINGTIPTDRRIYALIGTYNGVLDLNGANPNLAQLNGLIGIYDLSTDSWPVINDNVVIYDLPGGFTLSGFTINGMVNISGTGGTLVLEDLTVKNTTGQGIYIHTNANSHIVLTDVKASGNTSYGAYLDNNDGGMPYNVTILNSYFDDNGTGVTTEGLGISTLGKIFMDSVSASRNNGAGISINCDFSSLTVKNAVLAKNDAIPDTPGSGYGLNVYTTRASNVILENIFALNASENSPAVNISTAGSITVKNAQVLDNNNMGMRLVNNTGTGSVKVYDSNFSNNGDHGLYIGSKGAVYLSSVKANDNTNATGVYIDNCQYSSGNCAGGGAVTITSPGSAGMFGTNVFNGNTYYGLYITSGKAISLTNITADGNGSEGMYLTNDFGSGGVKLNKNIPSTPLFTFYNSASGNGDSGMEVYTNGSIHIEYLNAVLNGWHGGRFVNNVPGSAPSAIIKYSTFNDNDYHGLYVESSGSIALTNVSASSNDTGWHYGVTLDAEDAKSGNVSIIGTKGYICQFNNNGSRGLYIAATGHITLKFVEVNDNGQGAYIYNNGSIYPKKITISNAVFNNAINSHGVEIYSKGNITLNTVGINDNDWGGAILRNTYGLGSITIKNSEFNYNSIGNSWINVDIDTNRNVTLYAVTAVGNGYTGVDINNCQWDGLSCLGKGTVRITAKKGIYNTFVDNGYMGFNIWANGNVILSNINASSNSTGLQVDNNNTGATGNVSLSASSGMRNLIENNASTGIRILSNGAVTIKYTDSFNNGSFGAEIDNDSALSAKGVTIKESTFVKNEWTGLDIDSLGTITLQGVDCSDNSKFNGMLDIVNGTWRRDVLSATFEPDRWTFTTDATHTSYNVTLVTEFFDAYLELFGPDGERVDFDDNGGGGTDAAFSGSGLDPDKEYTIVVRSPDGLGSGEYDINLNSGPTRYSTPAYGAYLENNTGTGSVRILYSRKMGFGARLWNNNFGGLYINSNGAVSVTQTEAYHNGNLGIYIYNARDPEKPVTVSKSSASGTSWTGIYIESRGNVTLKQVYAHKNSGSGLSVTNSDALVNRFVKLTSGEFLENSGGSGIYIYSKGNVIVSNVIADNPEADYGLRIDNREGTGNVTLTGKENLFINHDDNGIYIQSHGHISLTNFSAINNGNYGVYARNGYTGFDPVNIKINNTQRNGFSLLLDNASNGLYLSSLGTISVNKVYTENNGWWAYISNSGSPEIKKISVTNSVFSYTGHTGINIEAHGPVVVSNVQAFENSAYGISIWNTGVPGQDVIINKSSASENGSHGFDIHSAGLVSINKSNTIENGANGITIDNTLGDEGITILSTNSLNNTGRGIRVDTNGPVVLKTITSSHNDSEGLFIRGVTVDIAVTLYKVNTVFNAQQGMVLDGVSSVIVNLSNSIGNGAASNYDGLYIIGNGSTIVTINKSTFMGNYGSGVELNNTAVPTITASLIFGNDVDGTGDKDLFVY